jgi:hypothetical protein
VLGCWFVWRSPRFLAVGSVGSHPRPASVPTGFHLDSTTFFPFRSPFFSSGGIDDPDSCCSRRPAAAPPAFAPLPAPPLPHADPPALLSRTPVVPLSPPAGHPPPHLPLPSDGEDSGVAGDTASFRRSRKDKKQEARCFVIITTIWARPSKGTTIPYTISLNRKSRLTSLVGEYCCFVLALANCGGRPPASCR